MTAPTAGEAGSGVPMSAADGTFDGSVEAVTWEGGLAAPPGVMCAWVHAEDLAGNWGPYASVCFVVISIGPDTVAPPSAIPLLVRLANANQDLDLVWKRVWDEGLYGGTTEYPAHRATAPRRTYAGVSSANQGDRSATHQVVDPARGPGVHD